MSSRVVKNDYPQDLSGLPYSSEFEGLFCPFESDEALYTSAINFLGLAQHHGMPTTFIDWTYNPLFAAHFATREWMEGRRETDIAVWAIRRDPGHCPNYTEGGAVTAYDVSLIEVDLRVNTYAFHQKGCFTTLKHQNGAIENYVRAAIYPALEELAECEDANLTIEKIILDASQVPDLRKKLTRLGVLDHVLMPTLDKVADTARLLWSVRSRGH